MKEVVTVTEAARRLGISRSAVSQRLGTGSLTVRLYARKRFVVWDEKAQELQRQKEAQSGNQADN